MLFALRAYSLHTLQASILIRRCWGPWKYFDAVILLISYSNSIYHYRATAPSGMIPLLWYASLRFGPASCKNEMFDPSLLHAHLHVYTHTCSCRTSMICYPLGELGQVSLVDLCICTCMSIHMFMYTCKYTCTCSFSHVYTWTYMYM